MLTNFKSRFWQPPRAHGDVIEDRAVSFLELFYDLVYVVVIARAAHHLAGHVTWRGVGEFAVIFGMIWLAWLNGTSYQDLHGRPDGRGRFFIFGQMLLLALLAAFTDDAAGEGGQEFAAIYTALLVLFTWLWYSVRRLDTEEYSVITGRYLSGMAASIAVIGVTIFLPDTARLIVWGVFILGWTLGGIVIERGSPVDIGLSLTDSLVERFGLFTIIVLGEVIVGVVTGLSEATRDTKTVVTGLVGLMIGFGFWWTYFDFVGRRRPRTGWNGTVMWMMGHLPVTGSIAASGAALVSLVEHAADSRAPANAAWLLTGSIALGLLSLIGVATRLEDYERLQTLYRPLSVGLAIAAGAVLLVGWARPAPWLLVLLIVGVLSAVWLNAVVNWLRLDNPDEALPGHVSEGTA